jgi:hypothetical protein
VIDSFVLRALCAASFLLAPTGATRLRVAEIEITGPFEGATLDVPGAGRTRIEGQLLAGESRVLSVPVPSSSSGIRIEPRVHLDRDSGDLDVQRGRLRLRAWASDARDEMLELTPALRSRPRPPVASAAPEPGAGALALLAASFVVGLALGRRPLAALAFGAAAGACVFALGPRAENDARGIRIDEGDGASSVWLEVTAARDRIELVQSDTGVDLELDPNDARLDCRVALDAPTWAISATRATLVELHAFRVAEHALARDANRWRDLDETWLREEGSWTSRGSWKRGEPMPLATSADPPPGWLASGLPQGTTVVLGRLSTKPGEARAYLRMSGF